MTTTTAWTVTGWQMHDNGWGNVTETTTGTYVGKSEFFTGLTPGATVNIHRTTYFTPEGDVSHVSYYADKGGAALSIHDPWSDLRF